MDEKKNSEAIAALPEAAKVHEIEAQSGRELLVMRAGARLIGVFADEVESIVEGLVPTPLPHAPPAVRGVVSARGRMCTVLDPLALLAEYTPQEAAARPPFIVTLRGDEQLALAVDLIERNIKVFAEITELPDRINSLVRGVVQCEAGAVTVLDPQVMFNAASRAESDGDKEP